MNANAHLTALEFDRLLACVRHAVLGPVHGDAHPSRWVGSPAGLDWERIVQAAHWHEVAPTLGQPATDSLPEGTPDWVQEILNDAHAANARRVRLLGEQLVAVVVRLRVSGVDSLPFRGPLLAAQFYPDVWSRSCENLDLLIPSDRLRAAGEALSREGYRFAPGTETMGEVAQWHVEHTARFCHPKSGQKVCLHAQIVPRRYAYRLDFSRLWQRARTQSLPAGRVASLSPEDWLLILSLHAIKNGFWPRLKLACDLARVIVNREGMDWDYVRAECRRLSCERVVLLGLALTNGLLGVELPPDWNRDLQHDPVVARIAARVRERLARGETGFPTLWDATRTHAALRRYLPEKLRYALAVVTTPSERDFLFLGRPVSVPGSYAVRGVKLAGKCVGQALGRFAPTHHHARSASQTGS